jgi:hypothetical protein
MNILGFFVRSVKHDFVLWFQKHCPVHIPRKFPKPPSGHCSCGKPYTRIIAIDTGDGLDMEWACEDDCGEGVPVEDGWWPFWFGAWGNTKNLAKIGIEIV